MHLAPIDDIPDPLHLERLLPQSLLSQPLLLIVTPLKCVPQLLVLIHQVLSHTEQLHYSQSVCTLSPTHESCLEVTPVQLYQTEAHTVHSALPVLKILLPDH